MALKYRMGGILAGQTLTIDKDILKYQSAYGKRFSVPISQIDSITVDTAKGTGKAKLKIVGNGTELASVDVPAPWASKAQAWLMDNIHFNNKNNSIDDLEKLSALKDKGIITEQEFSEKKKQILG